MCLMASRHSALGAAMGAEACAIIVIARWTSTPWAVKKRKALKRNRRQEPRFVGKDFRKDWAAALEVFRASLPRRRQGQPAGGTKRASSPSFRTRPIRNKSRASSPRPFTEDAPASQRTRPHRTGCRRAQTLQTRRPTMREDEAKFRIHCALTAGFILVRIRPHRQFTEVVGTFDHFMAFPGS